MQLHMAGHLFTAEKESNLSFQYLQIYQKVVSWFMLKQAPQWLFWKWIMRNVVAAATWEKMNSHP